MSVQIDIPIHGILLSNNMKHDVDVCNTLNKSDKQCYAGWKKPVSKDNILYDSMTSLVAWTIKNSPTVPENWVQSLEKGMATHSSILAWRISWTEEPGRLQSMGLQKTGHHWATNRRGQWHPTPVLLPGKSHGRRSLVGYSPWGRWESDTTERLHFHFSLSCFGEGDGNPTQCSCLENPRDRGARWASVYGVAQSRTRLARLSSSSRETNTFTFKWHFRKDKNSGGKQQRLPLFR